MIKRVLFWASFYFVAFIALTSIIIGLAVPLYTHYIKSALEQDVSIEVTLDEYEEEHFEQERLIVNEKDVACLAVAIFHEARGESHNGQIAVANVIMNRAREKFPEHENPICETVYKNCHFSFSCDKRKQYDPAKCKSNIERNAWDKIQVLAREAIIAYHSEGFEDITKGATYYHEVTAKPKWRKNREKTIKIDRHVFYRKV